MKNSTFLGGFLVALCLICMAGTIYPGGGGGGTLKGIITTGAASGTTNNSVVTIDVSGTGGDVLAAGNTTFTGNNIFGGTATSNTFTHVVSFGSPVTFSNRVDITGALTTPTINGNVVHGGASNTFTGILSVGGDLSVTGGVYTAVVTANTANFGLPTVLATATQSLLSTNGAGNVVVTKDGGGLTNLILSSLVSPTNAAPNGTDIDLSIPEATTNAAGNITFSSFSNFNSTNYNDAFRWIEPNGADRTVTCSIANCKQQGGPYVCTNGTSMVVWLHVQINHATNFYVLQAW